MISSFPGSPRILKADIVPLYTVAPAASTIGPSTPDIESAPQRSRWLRLGLTVGGQFR
jgi:hypothetical protein